MNPDAPAALYFKVYRRKRLTRLLPNTTLARTQQVGIA
jgi:hypothetical protein